MREIVELRAQIEGLRRRIAGMVRHGTVHVVDAKAGTVRLRLGGTDAEPFLSPAIPYAQVAGALKVHSPPSVGQQMTLMAPSGDFRQATALPMTWSDANGSPSEKGDEHVATFGDTRVEMRGGDLHVATPKIVFECGGVTVEVSAAGVEIKGDLKVTGGAMTHEDRNVGSDHRHTGVRTGSGRTGAPEA